MSAAWLLQSAELSFTGLRASGTEHELAFPHRGHHSWRTDFGEAAHTKEVSHYLQDKLELGFDSEPIKEPWDRLHDAVVLLQASDGGQVLGVRTGSPIGISGVMKQLPTAPCRATGLHLLQARVAVGQRSKGWRAPPNVRANAWLSMGTIRNVFVHRCTTTV